MFEVGDYVVHNGHGVCILKEIISKDKQYYKLESIYNAMTIMIPCEKTSDYLRPILSRKEIESAIHNATLNHTDYIKNNKERKLYFQQLVFSNDINDTLLLVKLLYQLMEDKRRDKKILGSFDTQFLQQAEKKLFYELSIVLNKQKEECKEYIYQTFKMNYAI